MASAQEPYYRHMASSDYMGDSTTLLRGCSYIGHDIDLVEKKKRPKIGGPSSTKPEARARVCSTPAAFEMTDWWLMTHTDNCV